MTGKALGAGRPATLNAVGFVGDSQRRCCCWSDSASRVAWRPL